MIVQGSMNYGSDGRKMFRPFSKRRSYTPQFEKHEIPPILNWRGTDTQYPSAELTPPCEDETAVKERQYSNHTIAPAYNKGAYQVISAEDIKHIGR
jgi:hypothetical protein|tara:strand:+ start:643 stop:930 length:288 start_codon:yes stop_codon:yes gene_type:complete